MYSIKLVNEKSTWDSFIDNQKPSTFMHAWAWGEAEKEAGREIFRYGIFENNNGTIGRQVGAALAVFVKARRGNILLCPHGPILSADADISAALKIIRDEFEKIGREKDCVTVRISTIILDSEQNRQVFKNLGFRRAPIHVYPELSWILDVTADDETLLKGMKKNTRYGIRKAERDDITIISSTDEKDLETFWKIYSDTATRQSFVPHPRCLVESEFRQFAADSRAKMYFAKYQEKIISTALIIYGADSAFYHLGASEVHSAITPGELLQWQIIQDARAKGLKHYNFWGVVPEGKKDHAWAHLDRFKKGFGGYSEAYVPTQDYPLSWKYGITYLIEAIRKWKRKV